MRLRDIGCRANLVGIHGAVARAVPSDLLDRVPPVAIVAQDGVTTAVEPPIVVVISVPS